MLGPELPGRQPQPDPLQGLPLPPGGHLPETPVQPHLPGPGAPSHPAGDDSGTDARRHGSGHPEAGL